MLFNLRVSIAKGKWQGLKLCGRNIVKKRTPAPEVIFIGTGGWHVDGVKLEASLLSVINRSLQRKKQI